MEAKLSYTLTTKVNGKLCCENCGKTNSFLIDLKQIRKKEMEDIPIIDIYSNNKR